MYVVRLRVYGLRSVRSLFLNERYNYIRDTINIRTMDITNNKSEKQVDNLYSQYKVMDIDITMGDSGIGDYKVWTAMIHIALPRYAEKNKCSAVVFYEVDIDPFGYYKDISIYGFPASKDFIHNDIIPRIREKIQTLYPEETAKQWTF